MQLSKYNSNANMATHSSINFYQLDNYATKTQINKEDIRSTTEPSLSPQFLTLVPNKPVL